MRIHESGENYLETIHILRQDLVRVRSIDVCNKLNFSKPTVSVMLKQLRQDGFVEMDPDGYIQLTGTGAEIAQRMYERHIMIAKALMAIGVDQETAQADSCKIEHDISAESFECIKKHFTEHQKQTAVSCVIA